MSSDEGPPPGPNIGTNNFGPHFTTALALLPTEDGSAPPPLIPATVVNFQMNSQIGWANSPIQTQTLPEHAGSQTTVNSQEMAAIHNAVPSQPNPSQVFHTPSASFMQAVREVDPTPSYPMPHASLVEAMQAVDTTSPTFTRARTPTPSVTSLSSPMEAQASAGITTSSTGPRGDSPDKPIVLVSTDNSLTSHSGPGRAEEARRALFPTSSEDFPPLSQIPPRGLFLGGNTPSSSGMGIDVLSPQTGDRRVVEPQTRGASTDPNFDSTLVLFPAGKLPSPLGSGQTGPMEIDSLHVHTNLLMEGLKRAESEIRAFMPTSRIPPPPFTREHLRAQSDSQRDSLPDVPQTVADKAYDEMLAAVDDIESLVQGYSYYFLEGELRFLKGNAIAIPSDQLMRIMQSLTGILSMGPRGEIDRENGDIFASLTNDSWCRLVMALLGAILRGCTRTRDLPARCNFELGSEDDFDIDDQLRQPATQLEAIQFMIAQLNEQFLPNANGLPAPRVEEIRTRIWAKLEDALRAELEAEAAVFSSCISGMGISDIFEQIMSGVSHQELTETMREEIQLEERSRFRNLLLAARGQATDYALAEAVADGQAEADILCADDRAELEEYKRIQVDQLERRKLKIREKAERELADFNKSTEAILAEQGVQQRRQQLDSVLQAFSNKAEFEFIRDHAIRLGIVTRDDVAKPAAKRSRAEPKSTTAAQTVAGVRSRSASRSSESRKRVRSASPPALSKPSCVTSTPDPSGAQAMEEDTTPKASPVVAFPQAQPVETGSISSSVPTRSLGTSMHAPGNEMVDDSSPLPTATPNHRIDETFSSMMKIFFQTMDNRLTPIIASVQRLSDIVDGRTPPKHATSAKPPPPHAILPLPKPMTRGQVSQQKPYPKPSSGGDNSGGPHGSPQGEDNDIRRPSSDVCKDSAPANLNPIATHEESGETRESGDQLEERTKVSRKRKAKDNREKANAKVPGAAPAPAKPASRIAPTFVQVTTAQMLRQQDAAKGFRVAASKAQHRKESGMPRRGNALSQTGTTEVTVIRFGGLENRDEESSLLRQHPSSFVEAAQRALNRLSKHAPPTILKGRWSSTSEKTGNFVYTLSGTYPPDIIDSIKAPLCSPFKGPSTLVPANGWTWAQLRQVPNKDEEMSVTYNADDLMRALTANPCFQSVFIPVPPSWIGNPENFSSPTASVSFAYVEQDKAITQRATLEGVCMFGRQVQFVHCGDKAIIVQCSRCHSMEHFARKCPVPEGEVRCPKCNGNHTMKDHDYECPGRHRVPGKCDCVFKCILCNQPGHHARSKACPRRHDIVNAQAGAPLPPRRTKKSNPKPATKPKARVDDEIAAGIARSQQMAKDNNLVFDMNDPLGLRAPVQTYEKMSQEEFERQRLEDDRQAMIAQNLAINEERNRHSIPRARPLARRSEAEENVDQMYAEINDEPFNLDAHRLEQSRLALEAAHDWNENHTPGDAWGPGTNGPRIPGPAPPTPYDALAPLPNPQAAATVAPVFTSQSPTAPSPNV